MSQMRLSVADAPPADDATHVVIVFTGVELARDEARRHEQLSSVHRYQPAAGLKGAEPGTYTVAFTCQAALDNRALANSAVTFSPVITGIVVTADHTTVVNIS